MEHPGGQTQWDETVHDALAGVSVVTGEEAIEHGGSWRREMAIVRSGEIRDMKNGVWMCGD